MSERLRFAELFAGAGGLSMGLERAGWECSWHAEIAEAPRAILRHRWPDTPLYGDVTTLDGRALVAEHGPIDLLTGGSPCQDLSVAGKRAGLAGARSGLFYEQMRLWDETGADLCLWENVDGARSSNNGRDFGEVLRAFVGAAVPLPSDGWRTAGVAAGPTGVAAWRVLDAQFFGVPQRRRRIFVLGTRTGRVDPAEILSLAEGVCGDSQARGEAREGSAGDASEGTRESRGVVAFDWMAGHAFDHAAGTCEPMTVTNDIAPPIRSANSRQPAICLTGEVTHALTHEGHDASEDGTGRGTPIVAGTLSAGAHPGGYNGQDAYNDLLVVSADISPTLRAQAQSSHRADSEAFVSTHGIPRRLTPRECERLMSWPDDSTMHGILTREDCQLYAEMAEKAAREATSDIKRIRAEKRAHRWAKRAATMRAPKLFTFKDAPRYKACGNGVASVHSHWIGWRLALALTPTPEPSHD